MPLPARRCRGSRKPVLGSVFWGTSKAVPSAPSMSVCISGTVGDIETWAAQVLASVQSIIWLCSLFRLGDGSRGASPRCPGFSDPPVAGHRLGRRVILIDDFVAVRRKLQMAERRWNFEECDPDQVAPLYAADQGSRDLGRVTERPIVTCMEGSGPALLETPGSHLRPPGTTTRTKEVCMYVLHGIAPSTRLGSYRRGPYLSS
jgi:hypothetical protein